MQSKSLSLHLVTSLSVLVLATGVMAQTILTENFDDNSAGWVFESYTGTPAPVGAGLDGTGIEATSDIGYDYSIMGIPEAPNTPTGGSSTLGARIRVNNGFGARDLASLSLEDSAIAGKYTVQVDMWLNYSADDAGIGTTEFGGIYVGDAIPGTEHPDELRVQRGAGAYFTTDGDCGNCDHILAKNHFEMDTASGQYSVNDFGFGNQHGYDNTDVNTDPAQGELIDLPALFPSFVIGDVNGGAVGSSQGISPPGLLRRSGVLGFQWVTLTVDVDPTATGNGPGPDLGTATFSVTNADTGQSYTLGTVDNSQPDILDDNGDGVECSSGDICVNLDDPFAGDTPVDMEGRVSLILIDFFSSVASDQELAFALFDNVVITQTTSSLLCDADGDGDCDATDIDLMYDAANTVGQFDFDGSGTIDGNDVNGWLAAASDASNPANPSGLTYVLGDTDFDGSVDSSDLGVLLNNFGDMAATPGAGVGFTGGDLDMNGVVDSSDLGLLLNLFGTAPLAAAVPEPPMSANALVIFMLLAAWTRSRR